MRTVLLCALSVAALAAEPVQLFNGKDLTGWRHVGPGRFVIEDGMLKTEGGMGLLYYTGQKFGNQTIRVVFKTASPNANSGVYIRLPEMPPDPWYGVHQGFEVQIDAGGDEWHSTGAIYSLSKITKRTQKPQGEWNTMDIQMDGPITRVSLNGELVNEFDPSKPVPERKMWYEPVRGPRADLGYIGLQNHDPRSVVYFKEVSVQNGNFAQPHPVPQGDRDRMLSYFHATRKQVLDAVQGLTPAQWNYKPAPEKWSIAEILEHLTISEDNIFGGAMSVLRSTAPAPETLVKDEEFIARVKDRSKPAQAPEAFRPTGKWKPEDLIQEFRTRRDRNVQYIIDTQDDLRGKYAKGPTGTFSAYQTLLVIPAHCERHLEQINEVKASAGYPKK